ncbi:polysaccharide deacetylase family protein [Acidihalobacter yilgarnensis]|uniref:polysaccharide deacetylase family protein n=1 Tax=Acidihalobacter yilgarnensis TaxID=2819280 RepID=UPI0012EB006B|nr:polysaccharide deacetylase family protein [Acidihalobacter yilgarnensis]
MLTVVVDTEEEFDWNEPFDRDARSTRNILQQPLAQAIMDRYGVVPTYVVDYPVADTPESVSVLRTFLEAGRCEIGAHLHPWVNPPHEESVNAFHSYPGNLPPRLEREKLSRLANKIEEAFGIRPSIYKAGRYGLGPATYETLQALGFKIDVSVVPHTDFSDQYGPNFIEFPDAPFQVTPELTTLPLSVHFVGALASQGPAHYSRIMTTGLATKARIPGIAAKLGILERLRLSPEGHSLADMMRQTNAALKSGKRYFMLTYHSSSLLPGATNYVRSNSERDQFLRSLDGFLSFFQKECLGEMQSVSSVAKMVSCE